MQNLVPYTLILIITILSGIADAYGFTHASEIWRNGTIVWDEFLKSAIGFFFGITLYWMALRFLKQVGVNASEVQTLFWFGFTIVGVALLSGKFFQWERIDQVIAVVVLLGIGWLLFHAGA